MLSLKEIAAMDKRRADIKKQQETHNASGQCTRTVSCSVCLDLEANLKVMDEIAADHGRI